MVTRRRFLATAAAVPFVRSFAAGEEKHKLRTALIGVAGQGEYSLKGISTEEVIALCDVDESRVVKAREQFPKAEFFTDYRKMFDKVGKNLDAVAVATPDHTHAHAALLAIHHGKHVYCEKPLGHSVKDVRAMIAAAKKAKIVTQMGTQIHAGENYRRVVEIVKSGALGKIQRVQVWCSRRPDPGREIKPVEKVKFDTNLWLGPVSEEFFYANHMNWPHFHWRWWWAFGGGVHADMGCHFTDLAHWALDLPSPITVKAEGTTIPNADNTVPSTLRVDYTYPTSFQKTPVHLTWYHGVAGPDLEGKTRYAGFNDGVLFEGENGKKLVSNYSKYQLLPDEFAEDFKPPMATIAKSVGHHKEWLDAIRGTGKPLCGWDYSGPLAEAVLLGNVSYRAGVELKWDAAKGTTGSKEADAFLGSEPRKGWEYAA